MTPKEKAKELVYEFWNLSPQGFDRSPYWIYAKKCALIAISIAIEENEIFESRKIYWEQVSEEIKKL